MKEHSSQLWLNAEYMQEQETMKFYDVKASKQFRWGVSEHEKKAETDGDSLSSSSSSVQRQRACVAKLALQSMSSGPMSTGGDTRIYWRPRSMGVIRGAGDCSP